MKTSSLDNRLQVARRILASNPGDVETAERVDALGKKALEASELPEKTPGMWIGSGTKSKPKIGMAVSFGAGSDSYPGTVVRVSKTGHKIEVRQDSYKNIDGTMRYYPSESDSWTYTRKRDWVCCLGCHALLRAPSATFNKHNCNKWENGGKNSVSLTAAVYVAKGSRGKRFNALAMGFRRFHQSREY